MIRTNRAFALMLSLCLVGMVSTAGAQDPHILSIFNAGTTDPITQTALGVPATIETSFDSSAGVAIAGWSWGVCHDGTAVDILSVADGTTSMTVNGGMPPAFDAPAILPGMGWTIGVVINFFGDFPLQPGSGYQLHTATYSALAEGMSNVSYCNTLGTPLVETTLVDTMGGSITPTTNAGVIDVIELQCFKLEAQTQTVNYDANTGMASFSNDAGILEADMGGCGGSLTQGFSIAIAHDGALLTAVDVIPGTVLNDLNGGTGPDFFGPNVDPMPGPGITVGVVYNFLGGVFIDFTGPVGFGTPVLSVAYDTVPGPLIGQTMPTDTQAVFSDTLGTPAVENTVVVDGMSAASIKVNGTITLNPVTDAQFVRGNCNGDGIVNIADGIWILNELFQMGPSGSCAEACDANDDDSYDQSDAMFIFSYRFLDGPPPPAPFPDCGTDPGSDCVSGAMACP